MNAKRKDEDVLRSILEPTNLDEEIESVLAMTPEQRRAELEKHGVDVKKEVHSQADAFLEQAKAEPPKAATGNGRNGTLAEEQARKPRPLRRRPMAAIVAAGVTAAAAGGIIVANMGPSGVSQPAPDAAAIRRAGLEACSARSWQQCIEKLDRARELDPDGDRAQEVQEARRAAEEGLHPK